MGPVATINTAPVAIGNSVRGSRAIVTPMRNGVRVVGRDFMFQPSATGSVTTWTMCGGAPLTPAAFVDSYIRSFLQTYQKFRFRKFVAHYITSSPTSATGDVMFYYGKNRNSVFLNQTSVNLLPFVMSDESTVMGPQWTNHSTAIRVTGGWKSTDYGMTANSDDYADGELFLLSKTSTTDSPGYCIFDYDIEFAEQQVHPRLLTLPLTRVLWSNVGMANNNMTATAGTTVFFATGTGNNLAGTNGLPTGATIGDVYKVILDNTNSTYTAGSGGVSNTTLLANQMTSGNGFNAVSMTIVDGMTLYAVLYNNSLNAFQLYLNAEDAFTLANPLRFNFTASASGSVLLQTWMSYIGSVGSTINVTPNF